MRYIALSTVLLSFASCADQTPVGPIPLRDAKHMQGFLSEAKAWVLWHGRVKAQFWDFRQDGTFAARVDEEAVSDLSQLFPGNIPVGTKRLAGKWRATATQLQLSDVVTGDGESIDSFALPLTWVDGKLRIEIGDHHYMRQI